MIKQSVIYDRIPTFVLDELSIWSKMSILPDQSDKICSVTNGYHLYMIDSQNE